MSAVEIETGIEIQASSSSHMIDGMIDLAGGIAGGTASVYIGQPLDTVKVKLQTFPTMYKNATDCFMQTLKQEGFSRGLYAGTVPSLAAQVSENAILFLAYGFCQKGVQMLRQKSDVNQLTALENASAGGLAAFFSSLVLCPTELIKCKLQAMEQMKTVGKVGVDVPRVGPMGLTKLILQTEGVPGLFRGLVPTFAREMPGYFFFFGGYELSRYLLTPPGKSKDELSAWRTMFCGAMGGVALWTAIFPADVIKSRAQVEVVPSNGTRISFFPLMAKIAREEGTRALYKGLAPTLLRTIPATGGLFLAYEETKKYLTKVATEKS